MPNAYPAKVGRTVHYRTAAGQWRPAVITAVTDADTATLRVGRHGETYATKDRRTDYTIKNDRWRPG